MKIAIFFSLLFASLLQAQTTQPASPTAGQPILRWQTVYWSADFLFNPGAPIPEGTVSMATDVGGRFDDDPTKAGYQENTYFVGEYHGNRAEFDFTDARRFAKSHKPGALVVTDIEERRVDFVGGNRIGTPLGLDLTKIGATDKTVQDTINWLAPLLDTFNQTNPNVVWGFYSHFPIGSYWSPQRWQMSVDTYEKWKRGEALTTSGLENDLWKLSCFTRTASGYYKYNPNHEWSKGMQAWIDASMRLTYNTDGNGKKISGAGIVSRLRVLCPSLYLPYPVTTEVGSSERAMIFWNVALARKISDAKKPVYAYVWNYYDDGPKTPMTEAHFRAYIRLVFQSGVDGVICWDMGREVDKPFVQIVLEEREYASRQPATWFMDWKKMPWPDTFK